MNITFWSTFVRLIVLSVFGLVLVLGTGHSVAQEIGANNASIQQQGFEPITPENVDRLAPIGTLGYGYSTDVAWSSDGTRLAVATSVGVVTYDGALQGTPLFQEVLVGSEKTLNFSPDGRFLLVSSEAGIAMLDLVTGESPTEVMDETVGEITSSELSPDGQTLAIAKTGDIVLEWDVEIGQFVSRSSFGHSTNILDLIYSPTGSRLAMVYDDGFVRLWDTLMQEPMIEIDSYSTIKSVAFSPDGTRLAIGGLSRIQVWDATTSEMQVELVGHGKQVNNLVFSPDGTLLVSGSNDNTARLWDVVTGETVAVFSGHTGNVVNIVFSPDGAILATASNWTDSTVRVWDVATGTSRAVVEGCGRSAHKGEAGRLAFGPDGAVLAATCSGSGILLWDVVTEQPRQISQGYGSIANSLAFSPDGAILAASNGAAPLEPSVVNLWNMTTQTGDMVLAGHTGWVRSVAISPDGRLLATGSGDGTARLWDMASGETLFILEGGSRPGASTWSSSTDDGELVARGESNVAAVWDVAFSPDSTLLAVGRGDPWVGPGYFQLWDVNTGELLAEIDPPNPYGSGMTLTTFSLAFSPDGGVLALVDGRGEIELWDVATRERLPNLALAYSGWYGNNLAFSPDGRLLAAAGGWSTCNGWNERCGPEDEHAETCVWNVATGEASFALEGGNGYTTDVAFSPDGRIVATAGGYSDDTVFLWEAETGELLALLEGGASGVLSVVFSPDGTVVATGGYDGVIRLWGIAG